MTYGADVLGDFYKRRNALRHLLLGRGWFDASKALEMALEYHRGVRKDGETPEVAHPIAVALWVWTLSPQLLHPQESVCTALLHDICEDHNVSFEEIENRFGPLVAQAVRAMTKEYRGRKIPEDQVFDAISRCPVASIVKPGDRLNNQDSMLGVFSPEKMVAYVTETEELILPAIKRARRRFPEQEPAYQNAKLGLESQVHMVQGLLSIHSPELA